MTDTTIIHYDIRAVTGVTRAACGIDNRTAGFEQRQALLTTCRTCMPTCEDCLAKIDMLARFGGDAIITPQDFDNRRWFIDAVREAIDEDNEENDDDYADFHQEQMALALKEHDDQYFLSQRKLIMEAVAETIHAGKFKFDETQLRGQIHRVLNSRLDSDLSRALYNHDRGTRSARNIEMTRNINSALSTKLEDIFNRKMAEATYLVGKQFMESDTVQNRLVGASNESLETFFEDQDVKDMLAQLMKEAVEEALQDNPAQFVQNIYAPENLSAEAVYRNARNALDNVEEVRPALDFVTFSHAELGDWAVANDCVRQWQYDTIMTRRYLSMLQDAGELEWPENYTFEEEHRAI